MSAPPPVPRLVEGYARFRRERWARERTRFEDLAKGQTPEIMILGCADSRVSPEAVFSAAPGEMFVVRNVANLVPPPEDGGDYHGTTAALEFAVTELKVKHIVVMGHSGCGGIKACLAAGEGGPAGKYIAPWVELAAPVREAVRRAHPDSDAETVQRLTEWGAVRQSLRILETMPFIAPVSAQGGLNLHGAWFSIAEGALFWLDPGTGDFAPVEAAA